MPDISVVITAMIILAAIAIYQSTIRSEAINDRKMTRQYLTMLSETNEVSND